MINVAGVYIFHFELSMGLGENTPVFKPWVRGKNIILKKGGGQKYKNMSLKTNIHPWNVVNENHVFENIENTKIMYQNILF